MPNPMKIQPLDYTDPKPEQVVSRPVFRSRVRRLFDRPRRTPATQLLKPALTPEPNKNGSGSDQEFDPSSLCLTKMVQNYIEEGSNEKQRCGKNRCNCFNGTASGSSDDEWESYGSYSTVESACDVLKSLAQCADVSERNVLADVTKIIERNKRRDGVYKESIVDGLKSNGYNASNCKSKWEKSHWSPAGVHEYVDVITEGGERLIIEVDFKSEFIIARPTKAYKLILQTLPIVFVGKSDRLEKIIDIASEAAKQSLKKRGMPFPPWRKAEYVKAKWLSPQIKETTNNNLQGVAVMLNIGNQKGSISKKITSSADGEIEIIDNSRNKIGEGDEIDIPFEVESDAKSVTTTMVKKWEPPKIIGRPKSMYKGVKLVTGGLASLIQENNTP